MKQVDKELYLKLNMLGFTGSIEALNPHKLALDVLEYVIGDIRLYVTRGSSKYFITVSHGTTHVYGFRTTLTLLLIQETLRILNICKESESADIGVVATLLKQKPKCPKPFTI